MAGNSFPLCQLPENAIKCVIQNMPDIKKIIISFCSKRMKSMAVSRGVCKRYFCIRIGKTYTACYQGTVRYLYFSESELPKEELIQLDFWLGEKEMSVSWIQSGLSLVKRINHVNDLFPNMTKSYASFDFDFFDLDLLLFLRNSDVSHLRVPREQENTEFNIEILNHFSKAKSIELCCPRLGNTSQFASILNRHFHKVWIRSAFKITFEELLLTNCQYLFIENVSFTRKQMNKFLKLWRRGSNPHLRYFRCSFENWIEPWNYDNFGCFLDGLNAQYLSCVKLTEFINSRGNTTTVQGGYQIWNKDGNRGVLHFWYNSSVLEFITVNQ